MMDNEKDEAVMSDLLGSHQRKDSNICSHG